MSRAADADRGSERRVLGFWSLFALGINGVVGVGIFFVPSELARALPGSASALAFAATALLLAPVAWTYGRLGSAYPEDGGPYVWAREALGARFGFGVGFITYVSAVLSTSAVVSGLGQYLAPQLGFDAPLGRGVFQALCALMLAAVSLLGLRPSAWVWSALTLLKLLPLAFLALWAGHELGTREPPLPELRLSPESLARAALIAVFPLQGFEIVPVPAGEVRGGARTVFAATLGALALSAALYVLLQLGCVMAVPRLGESPAPIVAAGAVATAGRGTAWFESGANISAIGIAFGMFAMTPRYLSALGTPELLGSALSHERRGVPVLALAVTTLAVLMLVSISSLGGLFVLSSLAVLLQYGVSAVALFRLAGRRSRGLGGVDRALAPLSLLSIAALAHAAEWAEIAVLTGILLLGLALVRGRAALASRLRAR